MTSNAQQSHKGTAQRECNYHVLICFIRRGRVRGNCIVDDGATHIIQQTEGFSFACLKELFLSSMMQWMAADGSVLMDQIIVSQIAQLREQMTAAEKPVFEGQ